MLLQLRYLLILLLLLLLSTSLQRTSLAQSAFEYTTSCTTTTSRFDIGSISCQECAAENAVVGADGRSCICGPGYAKETVAAADDVNEEFECIDCIASSLASSADGLSCIECDTASGAILSVTKRDCECPDGFALRETNAAGRTLTSKECIACPENTLVFSDDSSTCIGCPHSSMTINSLGTCTCGGLYVAAGETCVLQSRRDDTVSRYPVSVATVVKYEDVQDRDDTSTRAVQIVSQSFNDMYLWSAVQCRYQQNREACQALSNMCALQKNSPQATVCELFTSISNSRLVTTHGFRNWKQTLPHQQLIDDAILSSQELTSAFKLSHLETSTDQTTFSELKFMLSSYHFNGSFIGMSNLTSQLQLCQEHPERATKFLRFGTYYENKCRLDLNKLIDDEQTVFHDLFFEDTLGKLYPVPVKIYNYRQNGELINFNGVDGDEVTEEGQVVLHRRFFLYDNVSGKQTRTDETKVLVFAKTITLRTTMVEGSTDKIYPPLLIIRYAEREVSSIRTASTLDTSTHTSARSMIEFRVEYLKDTSSFWTMSTIFFVIGMLLLTLLWLVELIKSTRSQISDAIDFPFLVHVLFTALSLSSDILFWLNTLLAAYCFIFFKGQATAFFLLPKVNGIEETAFKHVVRYVFFAKLLSMIRLLWKQINTDIFFIDWEKARYMLNNKAHSVDEEIAERATAPVSVWRSLFVANEFNELQIQRTVNVELTLLILLFLLRGIDLEYLATSQPTASDLSENAAPINKVLRFAVSISAFLFICYLQRVYRQLIYHRFFEHKAAQFVDFMTMSNISTFILDTSFHGYYIHGKTLHAFADSSIEEMSRQLLMEKKSMVKRRGLVNGKDTFEIFVTPEFRLHYSSIFKELCHHRMIQNGNAQRPNAGRNATQRKRENKDVLSSVSDDTVRANAKLNRFLKNFIDRNSATYRWEERERSFLEKLFDVPPLIKGSSTAIFYDDPQYNFMSIMLMGIEYDIIVFLAATYAACDLAFNSTFASILIVFVTNRAITYIRQQWGQANIVKKTLVDERFLI